MDDTIELEGNRANIIYERMKCTCGQDHDDIPNETWQYYSLCVVKNTEMNEDMFKKVMQCKKCKDILTTKTIVTFSDE